MDTRTLIAGRPFFRGDQLWLEIPESTEVSEKERKYVFAVPVNAPVRVALHLCEKPTEEECKEGAEKLSEE